MTKNTRRWLRGLVGANIAGGAGAIANLQIASWLAPETFNFGAGLHKLMAFVGLSFVAHAIIGGAAYLQKSPLPEDNGNGTPNANP